MCLAPLNCAVKQRQSVKKVIFPFSSVINVERPESHTGIEEHLYVGASATAENNEQGRTPRPSTKITHAEFVSIIFPALGLDSRALKTATVEDRIDILESLSFAPAGGYQPDKTLTVEEASLVLAKITLARFGQGMTSDARSHPEHREAFVSQDVNSGQIIKQLRLAFSGAGNQPVSTDELALAIQTGGTQLRTVPLEAQTTPGSPISAQADETVAIRKGVIQLRTATHAQIIEKEKQISLSVGLPLEAQTTPGSPISAQADGTVAIRKGVIQLRTATHAQIIEKEKQISISPELPIEAQSTLGSTIPIQLDKVEGLLKKKLIEYYHPPYLQAVSLTD